MRALPQLHQDVFAQPKRQMTARQERFVREFLKNGGKQGAAAEAAGYAAASVDSIGSQLVRNPLIQQAIARETLTAIGLSAVPALATVNRLLEHSRSDFVKLEAARDLLDRAGFGKPDRSMGYGDTGLTVSLNLSVAEGVSKTTVIEHGDLPRTRKSPSELEQPVIFPWEGGQEDR